MIRVITLAAAFAVAACAPDPSQALGAATGGSAASGPGARPAALRPAVRPSAAALSAPAGSAAGGVSTLPPGFDPTKPGIQRGFWPDGTPWIVVVDTPWFR